LVTVGPCKVISRRRNFERPACGREIDSERCLGLEDPRRLNSKANEAVNEHDS
jgi:hypothetical protein